MKVTAIPKKDTMEERINAIMSEKSYFKIEIENNTK